MFDRVLAVEILNQIDHSLSLILDRFEPIQSADDFLNDDQGLVKLDAICMQLIAVGESLKNFDKVTHNTILTKYPEFEWKQAKGMRDIISHHYFDINSDIVFDVCKNNIPELKRAIDSILQNEFSDYL